MLTIEGIPDIVYCPDPSRDDGDEGMVNTETDCFNCKYMRGIRLIGEDIVVVQCKYDEEDHGN